MNGRPHRPADDAPREDIQSDSQVQPPFPRADVGDVRDSGHVRPRCRKLALQKIRQEYRSGPDCPLAGGVPVQSAQAVLAHDARDAMLAAGLTGLAQVEQDSRRTVDPLARRIRSADHAEQARVLLGPKGEQLLEPVVVAALGDAQDSTLHFHGELPAMGLDEGVGLADATELLMTNLGLGRA